MYLLVGSFTGQDKDDHIIIIELEKDRKSYYSTIVLSTIE